MKKFFVLMMLVMTTISVFAQWQEHEDIDMMTDARLLAIHQTAQSSSNTITAPLFVFRWDKEGFFEAYIIWGGWPMLHQDAQIRYGSAPAVPLKVRGVDSTLKFVFFEDAEALLAKVRSMPPAGYITVACTTIAGVQSIARFKVGDLQVMLKKNGK